MIYEYGALRWNDIDGVNQRTWRETCPSATISTTNSTSTDPNVKPGLRGERPATSHLSYGTAQIGTLKIYFRSRCGNIRWSSRDEEILTFS
jgi:hypothetical protein